MVYGRYTELIDLVDDKKWGFYSQMEHFGRPSTGIGSMVESGIFPGDTIQTWFFFHVECQVEGQVILGIYLVILEYLGVYHP